MNEEEKEAIEYIKNCLDNEYNFKNATRQKDKDAYNVILSLINKQQKEIERLKKESIGETKYERLLFSIRMLHFHHYINDNQFIKMINKLSNENKGE